MFEKKEIKMPIASTNSTTGLVSVLQLVGTTPSDMFATVRNDTSETEIQRIIFSPIELPKNESNFIDYLYLKPKKKETLYLSEKSLSKEWLLPEEDEAWKDL